MRMLERDDAGSGERFSLGVCYYPEHWPRDRWEAYAAQMRELGLSWVRIGEFAWSRIEPRPGEFDWGWLDDAIAVLADAGLGVVHSTPTAAPPAWLVRAHPEVLPWDAEGRQRDHGGRRHYDFASEVYREHSRRITRAVAERYGKHPAVVGWQTDNELAKHHSFSPAMLHAFREWLGERYADTDSLNEAWGNVFWSQDYGSFEEITLPNLIMGMANPSHVLDYWRCTSDLLARFNAEQVAILRELSPGRWVTHNFMGMQDDFDHYRAAAPLDFVSWDSYPIGEVEKSHLSEADRAVWARTGHPDLIAVNHDVYRGLLGGRGFWVMEQQAGQINWARHNPLPANGAVALWTVQAWAHGADVVSYFRWRAATMAQEAMHSGLLRHDETLDRGGEEVRAVAPTVTDLPTTPVHARVVLLHDYECVWVHELQRHNEEAAYWKQFMQYYTALRELGVDVDIRHPDSDLSGYDVIVAPALQIVDERRARHLQRFASRARMIFGPRAGYRTPTGRVQETGQPGPLRELLGCALLNFDGIPPGLVTKAGNYDITTWAESYRLIGGASALDYADGGLAGQAAVVRAGSVTTVGAWSPDLVRDVLAQELTWASVPNVLLPDGVRVSRRGRYEVWQNFNEAAVELPDGTTLPPVRFTVRPR